MQDIRSLQHHLGSLFVTTAFLDRFSGGLASNVAMTIGQATRTGLKPFYRHGAEAALPMASVLSAAHAICTSTLVTDEHSLEDMLMAVHKQFDAVNEYNDTDKAHALETLEHVFPRACQWAREALEEVQAGFPTSEGDFAAWKQALFWREHRKDTQAVGA